MTTASLQVGVYRKVAKRFASIMQRGLASAFREWQDFTIDMRAANNRAYEHVRRCEQLLAGSQKFMPDSTKHHILSPCPTHHLF